MALRAKAMRPLAGRENELDSAHNSGLELKDEWSTVMLDDAFSSLDFRCSLDQGQTIPQRFLDADVC